MREYGSVVTVAKRAKPLELKWLEDFVSLARTRNFSRSSEERNVTQPAFSRRIRALELWLGADLIDRRTHPVALTEEGRQFRETAEIVLNNLYHDRNRFRQLQHMARPDIRITAASTLSIGFIPSWLERMQRTVGPFTSRIMTERAHLMVRHLVDGGSDFVVQYFSPHVPALFATDQVCSFCLAREKMVLVAPCDRQGKAMIDPDRDGDIPYIGYSRGGYFAEIESLIFAEKPAARQKFRRLSESPTSEFVKRMAVRFGALALVPQSCVGLEIGRREFIEIMDPGWSHELEIRIYRKVGIKRRFARKFWDCLIAQQTLPCPRSARLPERTYASR